MAFIWRQRLELGAPRSLQDSVTGFKYLQTDRRPFLPRHEPIPEGGHRRALSLSEKGRLVGRVLISEAMKIWG